MSTTLTRQHRLRLVAASLLIVAADLDARVRECSAPGGELDDEPLRAAVTEAVERLDLAETALNALVPGQPDA